MDKVVKKVDAFNLDTRVIQHIIEEAKKDDRKKSAWLNRYLMKAFKIEQQEKAPKKASKAKFDFKGELIAAGVNEQTASDWLDVRAKKKASNTQTAFVTVVNESEKAGITLQQAVAFAASNSWSGFKASWYKNEVEANQYSQVEFKTPNEALKAVKGGKITHVSQIPSEHRKMIETQMRIGKLKPETVELLNNIGMVM